MTLVALGLNHQTAPVTLRERLAFAPEDLTAALAELRQLPGVAEAALVSTCNRTELYCRIDDHQTGQPARWLARRHGIDPNDLAEFLYHHENAAAVSHVFRVATGLDSLVLGEPQILGQVKQAYQDARNAGSLGPILERLFQQSFAVAKRARTETRIGANPVSVAFAAVRLAEQIFGALDKINVLLIGAGETIELAARHLSQNGVKRMTIVNRTLSNAKNLAANFEAVAAPLSELDRHLPDADLVIASTASREPLLGKPQVAAALRTRRHRPMLLIDLAVPRDIEADVAQLDDVFVYTVDDLGAVIEDSLRSRREAAREAEAIIELQVDQFMAWVGAIDEHGPLKRLRASAEQERELALARARAMLGAGRNPDEVLQFLANQLTNKLLHAPSSNLRKAALRGDQELLRAAERLFHGTAADDGH